MIWLIIEFISQFGGLEVLTPVNFVRGFIRAGSVFFIFFFVFRLYGNGRKQRQIQKWEARGWKTTADVVGTSRQYRYGLSEHDPMKRRRADYYVKYKYEVDGKSYYHDMITGFKNWKNEITEWYDKNNPKRQVTSEYSQSKRKNNGWVFTLELTLAAFLSGFSS